MPLRKPKDSQIEVDMVPLIDIISLLLMFLIIVGGVSTNAQAVKLRLPRADEGKSERDVRTEGRIVVSVAEEKGAYLAVIGGRSYELLRNHSANETLIKRFNADTSFMLDKGMCRLDETKGFDIPVKLRIQDDTPMHAVENLLETLSRAKLTNIQYAVMPAENTNSVR